MLMFAKRLVAIAGGAALVAAAASCHKLETIPTPTQKLDDFSGTVAKGGSSNKQFTVNYEYTLTDATVTLKTLTSTATGAALSTTIGIGFGSPQSDGSCIRAVTTTQNAVAVGQEIGTGTFGTFSAGIYCVSVFDAGTLADSANYTITVKHY